MYRYNPTPPRDTLAHYGIKGQKWGVRRYQNKDGSYTNAGKARYSVFGMRHDVRQARKAAKKENIPGRQKMSTGHNYDKAIKDYQKTKERVELRNREWEKNLSRNSSERDIYRSYTRIDQLNRRDIERGRRRIDEAMLRDAGYTQEEIRGGLEYLKKIGVQL